MIASQPKPKLTPAIGQPVTIALQYPTGKPCNSRIHGAPAQVYFSLSDGRSMFVPVEAAMQIDQLKLRPGEPFILLKKSPTDWEAKREQTQHGPVNGQGEDAAAILARCYTDGIDIALLAVETAREKGLMVSPTFEDIRAIAATLLISETGHR